MIDPSVYCAAISAALAIACAIIGARRARRDREEKAQRERAEAEERAQRERVEARAAQRAKEGRLQLAMIHAVGKLTVGVAMALKRGHCNGEVEDGLEAVQKADTEYAAFLESVAVEHLTNERG